MKKTINILSILVVVFGLVACDNMMDVHQEYLEGGETVYMPRPNSVEFLAGKNRVVTRIIFYNSPNVKTVDIYWNNRQDSLITPVTLSTGLDIIEVPIPNLDEKSYTFTVWATDAYGNHSLPTEGFGTAYGEMFQRSLVNQPVWRLSITEDAGLITWSTTVDHLVRNEIRYLTQDGDSTMATSLAGVTGTLPNAKTSSQFRYRSVFIPETNAVDTFFVDWTKYENAFPEMILIDKKNFRVLAVSDQHSEGGGMHMVIDDNFNTYWHSQYSPNVNPPHWLTMDLGKSREIVRIEIYRRMYNASSKDTKTVEFFVGDEPDANATTWKSIGSIQFPDVGGDNMRILDVGPDVNTDGRYLKLLLPDSWRTPFIQISEIYIYSK
ncbi:MAG: hypothetical protein EZS26_003422 [Candidatus Ordinivivax streblomastigis]|uniref:F5/8 type C domain-containing protein n=1 Tax=Candidatus Ordinivivax streblomastigis TaxID=2540710 RepID=A0A5M8NYA6_9BACT|nr:MAG: hypothetical protein EZS26_003422 [Candidatus Ordinivivax streblomastigis]